MTSVVDALGVAFLFLKQERREVAPPMESLMESLKEILQPTQEAYKCKRCGAFKHHEDKAFLHSTLDDPGRSHNLLTPEQWKCAETGHLPPDTDWHALQRKLDAQGIDMRDHIYDRVGPDEIPPEYDMQ